MGLGWTEGQERFTTEPQRDGLPETDDGGMVLKKPPDGNSPWTLLWEILKDRRCERFVSSFGKLPVRLLNDKSTFSMLVRLAMAAGIGPTRQL